MQARRVVFVVFCAILISMSWKSLILQIQKFKATPLGTRRMSSHTAIVVGSGLAGLCASSEIIARGISVRLLERCPKPGGNSIKASSGINGASTRYQHMQDTSFYADTVKSAGIAMKSEREEREALMGILTAESRNAVDWLVDEIGVDLSVVTRLGGHSVARTHRGGGKIPPGAAIIAALLKSLKDSPLFELETEATVTKVLQSNGVVNGVQYETTQGVAKEIQGPVVFATGGFAGDAFGMLAKYRPDLAGFPSTNDKRAGSQHLLTEVGAQLLDMDFVQVHPTAFIDPQNPEAMVKFLAAEMLRGEGGLLLDSHGNRFVNELETRKVVTDSIMNLESLNSKAKQWDVSIVLDEGAYDACQSHMGFYIWKGFMRKTTISDLPSPSASLTTIRNYATSALSPSSTQDHLLGRRSFGSWTLSPEDTSPETIIYTGKVTPAIHFTMGGVKINGLSEALDKDGKPIKGIWAAGEVTGGVHGENRLGGSSLLECVVFGRRAGNGVASFLLED